MFNRKLNHNTFICGVPECRCAVSHLPRYFTGCAHDILSITTWLCGFWCEMTSIFPWQQASLDYICPASSNRMCNKGQRVSPYSPRQSLALFMEDSTNYCCENNVITFIQVRRFILNMFYCGNIAFTIFNTRILKAWGSASRVQCPLTTGIVRRQFPSLRGTMWCNNKRSMWNGSRFEHKCAFYVEITNIQGVK